MAKRTVKIDDDVMEVLKASEIGARSVQLTGHLDRDLYVRVDKVLKAAGGKWSRKDGKHMFPNDPREALGLAMDAGEIVDQKRTLDQFFTPTAVAIQMVETLLDRIPGGTVLEPSVGHGAIASELLGAGYHKVVCVEVDKPTADEAYRNLSARYPGGDYTIRHGDFLSAEVGRWLDMVGAPFDGIAMNPPFSGDLGLDHVEHAWRYLRPGGCLVAILPPSWSFKTTKRVQAFRNWIEGRDAICPASYMWHPLPDDTFKAAGTGVSCGVLTLDKSR